MPYNIAGKINNDNITFPNSIYQANDIKNGLICWIDPRNGINSNNEILDISGNGNNLQLIGNQANEMLKDNYIQTSWGNYCRLSNFNGSVFDPKTLALESFTFEIYINKPVCENTDRNYILTYSHEQPNSPSVIMYDSRSPSYSHIWCGSMSYETGRTNFLKDTHIVYSHTKDQGFKLFVNGNLVSTSSTIRSTVCNFAQFIIGRQNTVENTYTEMQIYSVRLYNRELTATEVKRNYNFEKDRFRPHNTNNNLTGKLSMPQLEGLGEILNSEKSSDSLVVHHKNGTVIFKNPVIDINMPDSSIKWGLQPYYDSQGRKRLFCFTKEGKYPDGWSTIKYEDEGVNTIFYDNSKTGTNTIAGLITEINGKLYVYIAEGYTNEGYGYNNFFLGGLFGGAGLEVISNTVDADGYRNLTVKRTGDTTANRDFIVRVGKVTYSDTQKHYISTEIISSKSIDVWTSRGSANDFFSKKGNIYSVITSDTLGNNYQNLYSIKCVLALNEEVTLKFKTLMFVKNIPVPVPFVTSSTPDGKLSAPLNYNLSDHSIIFKGAQKGRVAVSDWQWFLQFNENTVFGDTKEIKSYWSGRTDSIFMNYVVSNLYEKAYVNNGTTQNVAHYASAFEPVNKIYFCSPYNTGRTGLFEQILFYEGNFNQSKFELELSKNINLLSYPNYQNDVISTYNIRGFKSMCIYMPSLSSIEIKDEKEKDIYMPPTKYDIPSYNGLTLDGLISYIDARDYTTTFKNRVSGSVNPVVTNCTKAGGYLNITKTGSLLISPTIFNSDSDFTYEINIKDYNASGNDKIILSDNNWGSFPLTYKSGIEVAVEPGNLKIISQHPEIIQLRKSGNILDVFFDGVKVWNTTITNIYRQQGNYGINTSQFVDYKIGLKFASYRLYSRALTDSEIINNYNYEKNIIRS